MGGVGDWGRVDGLVFVYVDCNLDIMSTAVLFEQRSNVAVTGKDRRQLERSHTYVPTKDEAA